MWLFNYYVGAKGNGFNGILFDKIIYKIDVRRFFDEWLTREGRRFLVETFFVEKDIESVKAFLDTYVDEITGNIKSRLLVQRYFINNNEPLVVENKPVSVSRMLRINPSLKLAQKSDYGIIIKGGDVSRTYQRNCKFEDVIIEKLVDNWLEESVNNMLKYTLSNIMKTDDNYSEYLLLDLFKWITFYMWRKKN